MIRESVYNAWARPTSTWSPWAKPVVFATMDDPALHQQNWMGIDPATPLNWLPGADGTTAIVLELPGARAVALAAAIAQKGYQPVPLFNGTPPPNASGGLTTGRGVSRKCTVGTDALVEALVMLADDVAKISLADEAPPVFMLDSTRMGTPRYKPGPGEYDNRWVVLPQDFPSATFMSNQRITRVVVVRSAGRVIANDLSHVLFRWQQAGIELTQFEYDGVPTVRPLTITKPSMLGSFMHRIEVMLRLRSNSAGGFGAIVPEPQSSGHYG